MLLAPRHLPRLGALVGLFTRYGLRDFAQKQGFHALLPEEFDGETPDDEAMAERAKSFRKRLVELGPAYIKLGQVLSTRPDLLPKIYIEELEQLQDDVGKVPFADIEAAIEEQLGGRISKLFSEFDHEPLGTASLGQVHAASLRDGRQVVVKVQRPNIREQLADDIDFFREVAQFFSAHTEAGHRIDMLGVIQQLERALADELDYRIEARNAATFRRALVAFPRLLIPRVIDAYTSQRVLTIERIRGLKITSIPPITRVEHDFAPVADEFAKAYLQQITIDGHFHADPHPGNIFVVLPYMENPKTPAEAKATDRRAEVRPAASTITRIEQEAQQQAPAPPAEVGPKLALIDFGMTARLTENLREQVVRLLLYIADNRGTETAETLIQMGEAVGSFDRVGYVRDIGALIARNFDRAVGEIQAGEVMYELINISYQRGLKLPSELTLLAKALFNLDAVSRSLDPSYNPLSAIRDYSNRIVSDRARRDFSPRRMFQLMTEASDLISALPHRIDLITQRLASNELSFNVEAPGIPTLLSGLQKIANRIFSGLVLAGLLVASAMLYPHQRQLGITGFVVAGAIAVYLVLTILVTDRRERR